MARHVFGYSALQIFLHWTVVVLVAFQFVTYRGMEAYWQARMQGDPAPENTSALTYLHVGAGLLVLSLALARIYLRIARGAPAPPADEPRWQAFLSEAVHLAIYLLLLALPVSGAVAWLFSLEIAGVAHELLKNILLGAIGLHIAGALFQHFIRRSEVMIRMLSPERRR